MSDCIFCKIIEGEIPSYTIYEDLDFKVILDAFPSGEGHTLILPKKHIENVFDIDDTLLAKAHQLAKKVATGVKNYLDCEGLNILQNNGSCAGQTVFHYHIHIIPRNPEDGLKFGWKTQELSKEDFEKIKGGIGSYIH